MSQAALSGRPAGKSKSSHRANSRFWLWLLVMVLIALAGLSWAGVIKLNVLTPARFWDKMGRPLLRVLAFTTFGLLAGQLIEVFGWSARLGALARPLIRWARLPDSAGASFTSAFVSGVLANSILFTSWQDGRLTRRGLVFANLLNASLPAYVLHMPTTLFIVISLTGMAGAYYVLLTFLAALLRMIVVAGISRRLMTHLESPIIAAEAAARKTVRQVWTETWPKFRTRLLRVILIVIPVYLVVSLAAELGLFNWLRAVMSSWVASRVVPVEALSLVVFALAAEFTSGFAAAGALLEAGSLSIKEVVVALILGNVLATPVRVLRHQLPNYMGIYTPGLGLFILMIGQAVRIVSLVMVTAGFIWLY